MSYSQYCPSQRAICCGIRSILHFEGLISHVPEIYFRFEGLPKRQNVSRNGLLSMIFRRFGDMST
ncbi:hypothetical protein EH245_09965 [Bifidobacterium breve]|nr:hypothetical protein EH245_09965 [Bifidobacterium breve]